MADWPDGILHHHTKARVRDYWGTALALLVLGSIMVIGLSGAVGGHDDWTRRTTLGGEIAVRSVPVLRNGEFFEMQIRVTPRRAMANLSIAIPDRLWRNITVNTMIPGATEETHRDNAFHFAFGPRRAGETIVFKIDGQINPHRFGSTHGLITVSDSDAPPLIAMPVMMRVLP